MTMLAGDPLEPRDHLRTALDRGCEGEDGQQARVSSLRAETVRDAHDPVAHVRSRVRPPAVHGGAQEKVDRQVALAAANSVLGHEDEGWDAMTSGAGLFFEQPAQP
ncbi:MAG: hypothetical protein JW895_02165 [Thermoleophilaceae bacterium]|nr:hypothetical protein [Thermoleophilaceae bacterium]